MSAQCQRIMRPSAYKRATIDPMLTFGLELKIVNPAVGNVHASFGFFVLYSFQVKSRYGT